MQAIPLLVDRLRIDTDYLRDRVMDALAKIGDPEAVRLIRDDLPERAVARQELRLGNPGQDQASCLRRGDPGTAGDRGRPRHPHDALHGTVRDVLGAGGGSRPAADTCRL